MVRFVGLVLATVALALSQRQGDGHGQADQIKLWAAISVPEPIFEEGDAERIQVSFAVFNDGHSTANPNVESSRLLINGVEPQDWSFVISNGIRSELFYALPPGMTLQFVYQLGPSYFLKPGIYRVRWKGKNFESPVLTFRVVPRSH